MNNEQKTVQFGAVASRFAFLLMAMSLVATSALGLDFEARRTVAKTVSLTSGRLTVEHRQGDVRIRTHAKPNVVVSATIRTSISTSQVEADDIAKRIEVLIESRPTGVSIRTEYPEIHKTFLFGGHLSYSVDYDIVMPATAPLELSNRFGNTTIEGLAAPGDITNGQGKLVFRAGRERQILRNSFGTIEVDRNDGDVEVEGSNGAVTVRGIGGSAVVTNRFGAIDVADVGGRAEINGSNGKVTVKNVRGALTKIKNTFGKVHTEDVTGNLFVDNGNGAVEATNVGGHADLRTTFGGISFSGIAKGVECRASNSQISGHGVKGGATIRNSFGKVELRDIDGPVEVENQNSGVTISDIGGNARVKCSFGLISAENVRGSLEVDGANGGIKASSIQGGARLETSFGPVVLNGVGGDVNAVNRSGSITVSGLAAGACRKVRLSSSFGSIRIAVPAGSSWDLDATTSFGRVSSELPVSVRGEIGTSAIKGTIGNGGCALTLRNQSGGIEIVEE